MPISTSAPTPVPYIERRWSLIHGIGALKKYGLDYESLREVNPR